MDLSLSAFSGNSDKFAKSSHLFHGFWKRGGLLAATLTLSLAAGCGGGGGSGTGRGGNTTVILVASSAANDQLIKLNLTLENLTLTAQDGTTTATLISAPQQVEFIHLNDSGEPLVTMNVPQAVYTKATITVDGGGFVCAAQQPGSNLIANYSSPAPSTVALQLPQPLVIGAGPMTLSLDLLVSQSATLPSNCYQQGFAGDSLAPTFNLTALALQTAQPEVPLQPQLMALEGLVINPAAGSGSFGVSAADSMVTGTAPVETWHVETSASTVFQGIGNAAGLTAGMPVDIDGRIQSDGSLAAARVAVLDPDTTNLTVNSGPLMQVSAALPVLYQVNQLAEGSQQYVRTWPQYDFGHATLAVWGGLTNLSTLPFTASFNASNLVPGQNVAITTHVTAIPNGGSYTPATTVTLMPQTINGSVLSTSSAGGFTTYTVQLAAYDMFPQFDTQPGQTTLITRPQQVVVYADSNTQITGNGVQSNLGRFTGVIFNDSGTLRMDATQIAGGVTE